MSINDADKFQPKNRKAWRNWLIQNHTSEKSVWVISYKQKSGKPSVTWIETVEEALCFGWIDSVRRPIDNESYMQFFTKRKAKSVWSKINKNKVEQLISDGLMTEAGLKSIDIAKQNGSWNILDEVEELLVPQDLNVALSKVSDAKEYFESLSKSVKKAMLSWITLAKRDETRQKRIHEIVTLASEKKKPKQF